MLLFLYTMLDAGDKCCLVGGFLCFAWLAACITLGILKEKEILVYVIAIPSTIAMIIMAGLAGHIAYVYWKRAREQERLASMYEPGNNV